MFIIRSKYVVSLGFNLFLNGKGHTHSKRTTPIIIMSLEHLLIISSRVELLLSGNSMMVSIDSPHSYIIPAAMTEGRTKGERKCPHSKQGISYTECACYRHWTQQYDSNITWTDYIHMENIRNTTSAVEVRTSTSTDHSNQKQNTIKRNEQCTG